MSSIADDWKGGTPAPGWREILRPEFRQDYMKDLIRFLDEDRVEHTLFPEPRNIFRAFSLTDYPAVSVCILGQDPYHTPGVANGLAFSVNGGQRLPPSLQNIYKEIETDIGQLASTDGDLTRWAKQGVFLLNTVLTVRKGQANSHHDKGWERFTARAIAALSERPDPLVFMLWGKNAQAHAELIDPHRHLVLKAAHPSPYSADKGFFGCRHFSKANAFLGKCGRAGVEW